MTFEEARQDLIAARKAYLNQTGTKEAMMEAAKIAATEYNYRAKAVALKLGVRPQSTTADRILRSIDRAIPRP